MASAVNPAPSRTLEVEILPFPGASSSVGSLNPADIIKKTHQEATEAHWSDLKQRLFTLYEKHPSLVGGDSTKGEIEVVTDQSQIEKIETLAEQRFLNQGKPAKEAFEWSRVGVMSEDGYFLNLRDAVRFPNGSTGLYNRQLERSAIDGTSQGAVMLPVQPDGKILFNLTYRHATRSWGMELPRGFSKIGEPSLKTAVRELTEETGCETAPPLFLGAVAPNTGAAATTPSIFLCLLSGQGKPNRGREAIQKCIPFSPQEVANALADGYFHHEGAQVPFIDGFSMTALIKAVACGHIKLPTAEKKMRSSE